MSELQNEDDLLRLGATYPPYGKLAAIHTIRGERYYAFTDLGGGISVSLLPARLFTVDNRPEEQTNDKD